jgi:RimJ/RimL family protein N-acetyltransferase
MKFRLNNKILSLRNIENSDENLLLKIYSSSRTEELKLVTNWNEEEKNKFLKMQFDAQHGYYQNNYPGADFWIIEKDNQPIGRLYIHFGYKNNSVRIIDITILPLWQNKGFGTQILKDIINYSSENEKSVSIHVESFNPAMKLYERLGFEKISITNGVYHLLEYRKKELAYN